MLPCQNDHILTTARTKVEPLADQAATYYTLLILDDPVMLAVIFC